MVFEFLSNLDTTTLFLVLIIFVLFVLSMKKVFSILMNAIWIAIAAILFPIVMNRFLGFDIPIDADSLISFVLLGLGVYFIYLLGRSIYKILGFMEKTAKKVPMPVSKSGKDKGDKEDKNENKKEDKKELRERQEKRQQEENWRAKLEQSKPQKNWHKDYVELKDNEENVKPKAKSHITQLPVIEKPKKRKNKEEN